MYKRLGLGFALGLFAYVSFAQVSAEEIIFKQKEIDFGTIIIEHGIVTATYYFTNESQNEFVISNIEAACGCTNPRSSKKNFAPGESGTITAEFNPKGMSGEVHKWVYVKGNFSDASQVDLAFNATLKSTTSREGNYPGEFGYLVLSKLDIGYGIIKGKKVLLDSFLLTNEGYHPITVKSAASLPPWISVENLPLSIEPKTSQYLKLKINTTNFDTIGPYVGTLQLMTNDQFFPKKALTYRATFETDYSQMKRRQLRKAPHIELNSKLLDLGVMKTGELRSKAFTISNTGKSKLVIKRIDSDCSCAILTDLKTTIEPGETITVHAQLDTLFKEHKQTKTITIYTNDPTQPKIIITLTALIK